MSQAANFCGIYIVNLDLCNDYLPLSLLENSLVMQDSIVSEFLGGWTLVNIKKNYLVGILYASAELIYHTAWVFEAVLIMCMSFDQVSSIVDSFHRTHNLNIILTIMEGMLVVIAFF